MRPLIASLSFGLALVVALPAFAFRRRPPRPRS